MVISNKQFGILGKNKDERNGELRLQAITPVPNDTFSIGNMSVNDLDLQGRLNALVNKELGSSLQLVTDTPIIKIVDAIIHTAYADKASDIHIEIEEERVLIRFRIDGVLHDMANLPKQLHSSIITRIKILSKLRTDEHFDAQDGKMRVQLNEEHLDIRVSVVPTAEGEKAVLRLLSSAFRSFSLSDLGMKKSDLVKVEDAISRSDGLILSTGPTGSGKTTSIYSLLKLINTREKNITTIEDPVEYRIKGVNHIPVNTRTGFTFAKGLRSVLRQDPDVIFVGEIRDTETANLAVNAALTGHLVFSTIHTNDAATAIPRMIDMSAEPFLLASTVNVVIAQRLVRKICTSCKKERVIARDILTKQIPDTTWKQYFGKKTSITLFQGKGCAKCHMTGYAGRVGIFEVLEITEKIRSMIMERKDAASIRKAAIAEGMTPLLDDGIQKITSGQTTLEEVLRVIKIEEK
jgi:type II secretory ATPase GspE/PulE/Tfp pilus assembly ATPase PilB-like protein